MASLVENVAEPNHSNSFPREVDRKSRGTAAEHPRHGVQLLPTSAEVVAGDNEIRSAKSGACGKQQAIFRVPKSMLAGRFGQRCGLESAPHRSRCHGNWFYSVGTQQRDRDLL